MTSLPTRPVALLHRLWIVDRPLTASSLLMLAVGAAALVGLAVDDRLIGGMPAWMKPAKFGFSTAIYGLTMAAIFGLLPSWPRMRRIVGWITAVVFVLEVGIISLQAWRGTTSHFNVGTPLDGVLFGIMGAGIMVQTLSSIAVAVALWRETLPDRALGWALRFALIITIVGGGTGGLMTVPTSAQIADARDTGRMSVTGAHTVGAPDGGPGLPGTGWSTGHGDLRVPHFVGLHAMQVLPLVALVRRRRTPAVVRVRASMVAAASYATLFGLLLWQALRGESVVHPSALTLVLLVSWLATTIAAALAVAERPLLRATPHHAI